MLNRRAFLLGASALGIASAARADCNACTVAEWQATREPYRGPVSGRQALACVRLLCSLNYNPETEVLLLPGVYQEGVRPITSIGRGNGHSFQLPNQPRGTEDIYIREFCFDPALIAGLRAVTFCNGATPGDGNHHTLSLDDPAQAPYLENLIETGHVGDFLSLLGTERTYSAPVSTFFTAGLYAQLYGRHGTWQGS